VLLGAIGAGLWLASSLGHTATAHAAVIDPPCCPVRVTAPVATVRTIVLHSVNTVLDPTDLPPTDRLAGTPQHIVLPVHALPVRTVPIRALPIRPLPIPARPPIAGRRDGSESGRTSTPIRISTATGRPGVPIRCVICRPDKGNQQTVGHPTRSPALPGGIPSGGGNASSVVAMALLAPANGHSGSPPGLPTDPASETSAPRSRTITPTSRPG